MTTLYHPITKEKAAEILSVSKRTIDNWISDGTLPEPTNIGRRVYWHPATFFGWLDQRLGIAPVTSDPLPQSNRPRGRPRTTLEQPPQRMHWSRQFDRFPTHSGKANFLTRP